MKDIRADDTPGIQHQRAQTQKWRGSRSGEKSWLAMATFLALAFGWSWALGFMGAQIRGGLPVPRAVLMILAGFGPSLAGFAALFLFSTSAGRRRSLSRSLKWRVGWSWFVLAFAVPPMIMLLAISVYVLLGGSNPVSISADQIPLVALNFVLVLLVGGPLGEEFGWRGYMTPVLRSRMGWRPASVIIGLVWGAWHLPLFFLAGTPQSNMSVAVFMLNILAGGVVFGWLYERTRGSVLPAIVLHTSLNGWAGVLGIVPTAESGHTYALVTGLLVLVAFALLAMPYKAKSERGRATAKRSSAC